MNKLNLDYFLKRIIHSKDFGEYVKAQSDLMWFTHHKFTLAYSEYMSNVNKILSAFML
jgi:hypothetical protein